MGEGGAGAAVDVAFSYAFQPIVDVAAREVFSFEALIRGRGGEPAPTVFEKVRPEELHAFDRRSRAAALDLAGRLGLRCHLNLNALPRSVGSGEDELRTLAEVAARWAVPVEHLILEVTEGEAVTDPARFAEAIDRFRGMGMKVAIDDFGAGYSGLNLLADFQPDLVKLDMHLVRGIDASGPRQSIVRAIGMVCADLGVDVIAEGVETVEEFLWLEDEGVRLFQGYLFAKPGFERLPPARFPGAGDPAARPAPVRRHAGRPG